MSLQTVRHTSPRRSFALGSGRSDVWLWRLLNDNRANFPRPVMVRNVRYFRLDEIERWEEANRAKPKTEASNAA